MRADTTAVPQPAEFAVVPSPATPGTFVFAKSGNLVGAVCADKKLRLWSMPGAKPLREFDVGGADDFAAMSADGNWVAATGFDGILHLWNASTGADQMRLQLAAYASAMALSPDGRRLAIAPTGEPVDIYDTVSGNKLFQLARVIGGTMGITFSNDLELIATADADTSVRIFDGRSGAMLDHNTDFLMEAFAVAFTPDRKQLLAAGADKVIITMDVAAGDVIRKSEKMADPVMFLEVSPDGKLVTAALMHADNQTMPAPVLVFDAATGKQVQEWLPPAVPLGGGWTSDGHLIAALASRDGMRIWRVR